MNKHASALGKMARGHAKTLSQAERKRRAQRLAAVRDKRWTRKLQDAVNETEKKLHAKETK